MLAGKHLYIIITISCSSRGCIVNQSLASKVSNFINFRPFLGHSSVAVTSTSPQLLAKFLSVALPHVTGSMMTLVSRCGGMYCGIHRYSDKHNCTFDYGALGKSEIAAANPVIVAEKVAKI